MFQINQQQEEQESIIIENQQNNGEQQKKNEKKIKRIQVQNAHIPKFISKLSSTYFQFNNASAVQSQNCSMVQDQGNQGNKNLNLEKLNNILNEIKYDRNVIAEVEEMNSPHKKDAFYSERKYQNFNEEYDQENQENYEDMKSGNPLKQIAQETQLKMKEILSSPKAKQIREQEKIKQNENQTENQFQKRRLQSEQKGKIKLEICYSNRGSPRQIQETSFTAEDNKNIEINNKNGNDHLDSSNQQCLICFEAPPDAVFSPCGHGGICYECSIQIMKKSEECFLCREPLKEIYHIDINQKKGKKFKVLSQVVLVDQSFVQESKDNIP